MAEQRRRWYSILYVQVLVAIAIGVAIGYFYPKTGAALKPLGDAFIQLIKMMIGPVIFCTVVHGIASMRDMAKIGRVGVKALVYFEVVSTLALAIGLIVAELAKPGAGFNIDPATLDPKAVSGYVTRAKEEGIVQHLLAIIPNTFVDAFAKGDLLQILLISVLTGFAVARMGTAGEKVAAAIETMGQVFFRMIGIIVRAAPIGALGAMAFTVGAYGIGALINLGELILTFYLTSILFVLVVLGAIAWLSGFSILRFIAYIRDELLIVLGTSSSETVLPQMMLKMERAGASRSVVGLVIPMGYSFNLDGTNIYMTLATLFLAQATGTQLTLGHELTILAIAMLTSPWTARGQEYPSKPVRVVVPYVAGGAADIFARTLGQKLSEAFKQGFVVENKPGANGGIGADFVAKSAPDGYTLLATASGPIVVNPVLYARVPYDPVMDFVPVAQATVYQYVLVTLANSPLRGIDDIVAAARAKPGAITYGSTGFGGGNHLAGELLALKTGTRLTHVPYKGSAAALADLLGGQLSIMFDTVITSVPQIRAGKLRPFAVSSGKRASALADVPTMQEAGIAGFDISQWQGILAPAGTPRPIVERLNAEIVNALRAPDVRERLVTQGGNEIVTGAPEDFAALIRTDLQSYARLIKDANIPAQ